LVKIFDDVLRTTNKLRTVFLSFIESLNVTMGNLANMLAYTFIIPVLPQLYQMAQEGFSSEDTSLIIKRLLSYGIITVSGIILKSLVTKILNRFKN
jgi:predicted MFS family arabinose efflux permease